MYDILKYISKLSTSQSEDVHGFSNKTIKGVGILIAGPLTYLFHKSLEQGIFPEVLKVTKINTNF